VLCRLLWVTLLRQGVGLSDLQRSIPAPNFVWFCVWAPRAGGQGKLIRLNDGGIWRNPGHDAYKRVGLNGFFAWVKVGNKRQGRRKSQISRWGWKRLWCCSEVLFLAGGNFPGDGGVMAVGCPSHKTHIVLWNFVTPKGALSPCAHSTVF